MIPLFTEKTLTQAKVSGKYTFLVNPLWTKDQIKEMVGKTFKVNVVGVQTSQVAGKQKRTGKKRTISFKNDYKKATVTLKGKEKIDLFDVEEKK